MFERVIAEAEYCLEHHATVREIAAKFGVPKSTVHKDLTKQLLKARPLTYDKVRKVLRENKEAMSFRGGQATKMMWEHKKNK